MLETVTSYVMTIKGLQLNFQVTIIDSGTVSEWRAELALLAFQSLRQPRQLSGASLSPTYGVVKAQRMQGWVWVTHKNRECDISLAESSRH